MKRYDFFNPLIVVVAILAFLAMGYVGSFNYRFEDPLDAEVILTIIFACAVFAAGYLAVKYKANIETKKTAFDIDNHGFNPTKPKSCAFRWDSAFQLYPKGKCNNKYLENCISTLFDNNKFPACKIL